MLSMSQFANDDDFHWAVREENKRLREVLAEVRDQVDATQPLFSQKEIEGMSDVLKRVARAKHARRKWRVKDYADGWIMYDSEEEARASEEAQNGALVEPAPE